MKAPIQQFACMAAVVGALAAARSAVARDGVTWKHGIIEPKSDSGLIDTASKRGFAEKEA